MFFVLALPRSRTFWLSRFLDCLHEGSYHYPNYHEFLKSDNAGDSTTCYLQVKDFIRGEKKVIIHRPVDDVEQSLIKLFGKADYGFLKDAEKGLREETGLHIQFEDIGSRLDEIWSYCKSEPYPKEMAAKMDGVIMENDFLIAEVRNRASI